MQQTKLKMVNNLILTFAVQLWLTRVAMKSTLYPSRSSSVTKLPLFKFLVLFLIGSISVFVVKHSFCSICNISAPDCISQAISVPLHGTTAAISCEVSTHVLVELGFTCRQNLLRVPAVLTAINLQENRSQEYDTNSCTSASHVVTNVLLMVNCNLWEWLMLASFPGPMRTRRKGLGTRLG